MKLKVKAQFENQLITRRFVGIGSITIETNKLTPEKMTHYYKNGFTDIFEYVENEIIEPELLIDKPIEKPLIKTEPKAKRKK